MKKQVILSIIIAAIGLLVSVEAGVSQEQKIAGTFFGDPVSKDNYMFVLRTVLSFRSPWGSIPNNRQQVEKRVWDDLILSYEAHRRGISVGQKELKKKIDETLKGNDVSFNWREAPEEYAQWVKETLGISVESFENKMQHLVQVRTLWEQVMDGINPTVTEKEAFEEFLNEYNSII